MKSVVISPIAGEDIESIGDYIAEDNPLRAISYVRELRESCHKIGLMPKGHSLLENSPEGIRKAVHGNYLIFYRETEKEIRIERVLHGARDYSSML
jgi:toxin ParE1/3/4